MVMMMMNVHVQGLGADLHAQDKYGLQPIHYAGPRCPSPHLRPQLPFMQATLPFMVALLSFSHGALPFMEAVPFMDAVPFMEAVLTWMRWGAGKTETCKLIMQVSWLLCAYAYYATCASTNIG